MSHLQAMIRTVFVYKVRDPRGLHVFYIDVVYCITIEGCRYKL